MIDGWASAKGGTYASRRGVPPPMSFFEQRRPSSGTASLGLGLADLRLEIEGLDLALAESLARRYEPWADRDKPPEPTALRVRLGLEDREYFIEPPERSEFNPVWIACDGDRVRYVGYRLAGWFETRGGRGEMLLARGGYEPELRAIENFVRAAVAWQAASRGGALVHGAGAVRNGKAYLFFGESGAGKSTLAAVNRRAEVVSDDLSLLLPRRSGPGLDLVGSPFRGTYEGGDPVRGRFPLAAAFKLVKAEHAEIRPAPRVVLFAQLVGNLTFVAEAFNERPDLFAAIERSFAGVPMAHLHFRRDDSYWDAIDRAGY